MTKEYPGYLSSQLKVDLVARVNGYLRTSYLKAGSRVKKGDLIFVIEPDTYQDNVTQAEASAGAGASGRKRRKPDTSDPSGGYRIGV